MKVLAGIVLFNPDVQRLKENISAILPQVDCLVLVENGSRNYDYIEALHEYKGVVYVKNDKSMGIAYALNQILAYAFLNGYQWALTLDQDSVVVSGMINIYKGIACEDIGIIGCWTEDRNLKDKFPENYRNKDVEVDWLISSASFTNVKAWLEVGGFDTQMFIDWVDWDICVAMRQAGYKIIKTYKTKLVHELAENTFWAPLYGRWRLVLHRPAFRYYYIYRNRIYMAKKYKDITMISQLAELFWQTLTCIKFEKHKLQNLCAFIKGLIAGFNMKIVKKSVDDRNIKELFVNNVEIL